MRSQLLPQQGRAFAILLVFCNRVQQQQLLAVVHVVNVVFVGAIALDAAILAHEIVHLLLNVIEPLAVGGGVPNAFDAFQYHALVVAPAGGVARLYRKRIRPDFHGGSCQGLRIRRLLRICKRCEEEKCYADEILHELWTKLLYYYKASVASHVASRLQL